MQADRMGNQMCVLPSAQSITVPSWATGCNGAKKEDQREHTEHPD